MEPTLKKPRLLITRCAEDFEETRQIAEAFGFTALPFPLLRRRPLPVDEPATHDWALFTSPAGVKLWPFPKPPGKRLACVGASTARAARLRGWPVSFVPSRATGTDLARELPASPGASLLLALSAQGGADVTRGLQERGMALTRLNLYDTESMAPAPEARAFLARGFESVLFASPTAARAWAAHLPEEPLLDKTILSIGPSTTAACGALGWGPVLEGESGDLENLFKQYIPRFTNPTGK